MAQYYNNASGTAATVTGTITATKLVASGAGSAAAPAVGVGGTDVGWYNSSGAISAGIASGAPFTITGTYVSVAGGAYAITTGGVYRQGTITTGSLSSNQNNYDPGLTTGHYKVRFTLGAAVALTGLAGGGDGRELLIVNTSASFSLTLNHEDAASSAANRFLCPNGAAFAIRPKGSARIHWDEVASRWQVLGN